MTIESLVRPNIRTLAPYRSARQDHAVGTLLDANENSFGSVLPSESVQLHRYPDPFQRPLRSALAEHVGHAIEELFVGVGSDEAIDLLLRVFCEPGQDRVLIPEPTYGMYRVAATIQNAIIDRVLLDGSFQLDRTQINNALRTNTKLVFVCSPNNPTGNRLRSEDILWLCDRAPGLVVVDEAYVEFAEAPSVARYVPAMQNLVVLRTLSKSWGLAAIRLGYAIAHPTVIRYLLNVKSPYNINGLTSALALKGLRQVQRAAEMTALIRNERERLRIAFTSLDMVVEVLPSEANFLTVRFRDPATVRDALERAGIIVRDRSAEPRLAGCLRITVGTNSENDAVLAVLRSFGQPPLRTPEDP